MSCLFAWWCLTPLSTIFQLYRESVLLVEDTGEPGENHRPVASHWQTLSHNVVHSPWSRLELTTSVVMGTDCIGSCKSNYHTITAVYKIEYIHSIISHVMYLICVFPYKTLVNIIPVNNIIPLIIKVNNLTGVNVFPRSHQQLPNFYFY